MTFGRRRAGIGAIAAAALAIAGTACGQVIGGSRVVPCGIGDGIAHTTVYYCIHGGAQTVLICRSDGRALATMTEEPLPDSSISSRLCDQIGRP